MTRAPSSEIGKSGVPFLFGGSQPARGLLAPGGGVPHESLTSAHLCASRDGAQWSDDVIRPLGRGGSGTTWREMREQITRLRLLSS